MYCIVCSYVGPIEVRERPKLHCIISMEKDRVVQRISILGSYKSGTPKNHDSMLGVPRLYAGYQVKEIFFKCLHNKR